MMRTLNLGFEESTLLLLLLLLLLFDMDLPRPPRPPPNGLGGAGVEVCLTSGESLSPRPRGCADDIEEDDVDVLAGELEAEEEAEEFEPVPSFQVLAVYLLSRVG